MRADLVLKHGVHRTRKDGMSVLEAVAWLAGEKHSNAPDCVCPVISAFVRQLGNGIYDNETRTAVFVPLLSKLIGTRTDNVAIMQRRAFIAADFAVREMAPLCLEVVSRDSVAAKLRSLVPIVDQTTAHAAAACAASLSGDAPYMAASTAAATAVADSTSAFVDIAVSASISALVAAAIDHDEWRRCVYRLAGACILRMCEASSSRSWDETSKAVRSDARAVVVCTAERGVFFGYTTEAAMDIITRGTVTLTQARMCVRWSATTRGVLGLASIGPQDGSRVSPQVPDATYESVTAVLGCTDAAIAAWEKGPWS
jgi:hypothetical protein